MGQANDKMVRLVAALKQINDLLDRGEVTAAQETVQAALSERLPERVLRTGRRSYDLFDRDFRRLATGADVAAAYVILEPDGDGINVFSGGDPDVHRYVVDRLNRRR